MSDTPRTDAAETFFGEMPGAMRALERELNAARAELAALKATATEPLGRPDRPGWLPIETAPKDGTEILLFSTRSQACGYFERDGSFWRDTNEGFKLIESPTHWMPLPATPPPVPKKEVEA